MSNMTEDRVVKTSKVVVNKNKKKDIRDGKVVAEWKMNNKPVPSFNRQFNGVKQLFLKDNLLEFARRQKHLQTHICRRKPDIYSQEFPRETLCGQKIERSDFIGVDSEYPTKSICKKCLALVNVDNETIFEGTWTPQGELVPDIKDVEKHIVEVNREMGADAIRKTLVKKEDSRDETFINNETVCDLESLEQKREEETLTKQEKIDVNMYSDPETKKAGTTWGDINDAFKKHQETGKTLGHLSLIMIKDLFNEWIKSDKNDDLEQFQQFSQLKKLIKTSDIK